VRRATGKETEISRKQFDRLVAAATHISMALGHEVKERYIARFDFKTPTACNSCRHQHNPFRPDRPEPIANVPTA
jgi:hypothetical protein